MISKKELAEILSFRIGASTTDCTRIIGHFLDVVKEEIKNGNEVFLHGIGKLEIKKTNEYKIKNFDGDEIIIPEQNRLRMKLSKSLRDCVKKII